MSENLRMLIGVSQLTPEMMDSLRDAAESMAVDEWVRRTGKGRHECIPENLRPYTHLNLGSVDKWLTTALVADTEEDYINHKLDDDEVVVIYGVANESPSPSVAKVILKKADTIIFAEWDVTPLYCDLIPIGVSDKPALWSCSDTVKVRILPRTAVAGGEVLVLLGVMAAPLGKFITK